MDERLHALNRFGLGARVGEARTLTDPRGWLRRQLDAGAASLSDAPARASDGALPSLEELGDRLGELRAAQRARDAERIAAARRALREVLALETAALLTARVRSDVPFVERLVAFWSNHLCVSVDAKAQVVPLAGHYERTVVRPQVLGRFSDMVLASARHPAMLFYLDNFQSIGPGSPAGRRTARRGNSRGLNENYARELLELHTVGVDGGYDQRDVEQLARILTGWTVSGVGPGAEDGDPLGYVFRPLLHEPGEKTVMGERYRGRGEADGVEAIRWLCARPETARFVATKLVRHFVSDDPPPSAVDRIAAVFTRTDGDLKAVALAVVDLDEAWDERHRKFRTPQEWLVAALRAFDVVDVPEQAGPLLRQLRHTPWAPASPKGFGDTRGEWADPDGLMNRAELARSLSRRVVGAGGRRGTAASNAERLLDVVDVAPDDPSRVLLADGDIAAEERTALALGGPAFQWR